MNFSEVYFQDVHGEEDLFHFQVEDHGDFYELIITEPQVKVVESAVYLFRNGVFYHLTPQQRNPMEGHPRSSNGSGSQKTPAF